MLSIGKTLTPEQRLSKAVVAIMGKAQALSGVIMIGDRSIEYNEEKVPTACTNGRDEWYGAKFIEPLNDAQLRFLVLHEVYHKLYRHLTTWQHLYKINPQLANMACDYVINVKIMDEFGADDWVEMIEGGCYDVEYRGWDAAKVFWELHKQLEKPPQGGGGSGLPDSQAQDGDEAVDGKTTGSHNTAVGNLPEGFDQHDWEGAQEMTADEQYDLAREIDEAIRQGALVAGKMGSGGVRDLEELLQPKVDWREALREFVQATCAGSDYSTWKKPNRRYLSSGIYMPTGISEQVTCLAEHNDMSGSIGKREQQIMISELVGICEAVKPEELHVSYWDTKVCGYEKYDNHELHTVATRTKPVGGGGTSVRCVPEYMKKNNINPQASIVFTDGYLYDGWGEWDHPVLWVIVDNENAKPSHGKTVHVKSGDL